MRNPDRIDAFCKELACLWHLVPDWRFGQLIANFQRWFQRDLFFPEDDRLMEKMKEFMQPYQPS